MSGEKKKASEQTKPSILKKTTSAAALANTETTAAKEALNRGPAKEAPSKTTTDMNSKAVIAKEKEQERREGASGELKREEQAACDSDSGIVKRLDDQAGNSGRVAGINVSGVLDVVCSKFCSILKDLAGFDEK